MYEILEYDFLALRSQEILCAVTCEIRHSSDFCILLSGFAIRVNRSRRPHWAGTLR
jgi:hypothetical protein